MDPLSHPTHPDHAEYTELVATTTNTDEPFDPGFLDIAEVTRALAGR